MKIIIDNNVLIYAAKEKIDLFKLIRDTYTDSEIIIPEEVLSEVNKLKEHGRKLKDRKAASLILQILNKKHTRKIKMGDGSVDDLLIKEAVSRSAAVITSDKLLKQKLKKAGVKTIYLRNKRTIEED